MLVLPTRQPHPHKDQSTHFDVSPLSSQLYPVIIPTTRRGQLRGHTVTILSRVDIVCVCVCGNTDVVKNGKMILCVCVLGLRARLHGENTQKMDHYTTEI